MLQLLRKPKKQKGKAPPPLEFASHVFVADNVRDAVAWLRSFGILPDTIKDVV